MVSIPVLLEAPTTRTEGCSPSWLKEWNELSSLEDWELKDASILELESEKLYACIVVSGQEVESCLKVCKTINL